MIVDKSGELFALVDDCIDEHEHLGLEEDHIVGLLGWVHLDIVLRAHLQFGDSFHVLQPFKYLEGRR